MSKVSLNIFQKDLENKVKKICSNIKPNSELEVSFGNKKKPMSLKKFHNLIKYLNVRMKRDKLKLVHNTSLDIMYNYDQKTNSTYRITINNIETINNFIQNNNLLKNHTIFSKQVRTCLDNLEGDVKNIFIINKVKSPEKFIELDEYDIRIKFSEENELDQSVLRKLLLLDENERHQIGFRFKQRISLVIDDNPNYKMSIDLTDVKSSNNLSNLVNMISKYELEVDVTFKKQSSDLKMLDKFTENILNLEQFLQESSLLVTKTESSNVIKNLNKLAYNDDNESYKDLPGMQSTSVEVYHVLDHIPGNYTATDKADGERYFLMILDSQVYLISNNLEVKKIKTNLSAKSLQYNLTVLDGEYLYIPKYRKFLYLTFDVLFFQGKDVREEESLRNRLLYSSKILKDVFNVDLIISNYSDDNIYDYHKNNIKTHLTQLNNSLKNAEDNQVINGKYFIFPLTVSPEYEIYNLSTLLWESYVLSGELECPYKLDGIIYTPINQKYTRNIRETKFKILKWKPENTNSIDFYVQYERNPDTKKIITVYDRTNLDKTLEEYIDENKSATIDFDNVDKYKTSNSVYQILNLYVGNIKNNQEVPVLFQRENDNHLAYIYLVDGYPRDIEGNIIQDGTVVEFAYNNLGTIQDKFRWIPLRTRFDKTESVMRFKRKYGNNFDIANRIWNSIKNPIKFEDIKLLSNKNTNQEHIKVLKTKITSETISLARRDDTYYQLVNNLCKSMTAFHNWIKSNIIYTYCSKKSLLDNSKASMEVLDIGTGRGGDLLKFFHAKVKSVVATDVNEAGFNSGSDGAISRYNIFKKKMPHFPKITFIVADAGQKLDYESQTKVTKMNDNNSKLLKYVFGENQNASKYNTFDIINAQFMIHYLLKNVETWENLCSNINKYLRKDGYFLVSTLDGKIVYNELKKGNVNQEYINEDGQKRFMFDIKKKYPDNLDFSKLKGYDNLGIPIDVHLSLFMEEGVYHEEYLVNPSFLINELKNKCGMRLVETETFQNLYYVYEDFFKNTANFESKAETRKFFNDVKTFYNMDDENTKKWFAYSKMNRYFIFQKLHAQ
jgi:SAM-dependent methyltransferase